MANPFETMRSRMKMSREEFYDRNPLEGIFNGPVSWIGFKTLDKSYQSAAKPPTCSEDCTHCSEQFLPKYGKFLEPQISIELHDDHQAKSEITDLITTINANLSQIRNLIESRGDAVAKRWKKRKPKDREALLRKARPEMYLQKGAEQEHMLEKLHLTKKKCTPGISLDEFLRKNAKAALTPYLNISSLREEPLKLLSLMHYRAYADLSDWILFDCRQMRTSFQMGFIKPAYNPHCMIAVGPEFGKLVQWQKDSAHNWDMIGYAAARLALKAQLSLSGFLLRMLELLLEGELSQAAKGHLAWDELANQGFKEKDSEGTVWAYADTAFSAAPKLDLKRMIELFTIQRNAAEDELWLLQTDPLHLRHRLDRFDRSSLHRQFNSNDKRQHLDQVILGNVRRLADCTVLVVEAHRVYGLSIEFEDRIMPGRQLPKEYEDGISLLENALKMVFSSHVDSLGMACATLPSFRHHFSATDEGNVKVTTHNPESFWTDKLFWNISELKLHGHEFAHFPAYHLANIDEILLSSKKEKERVDQLVLDHLSDIATIEEALNGIRYHRSRQCVENMELGEESLVGGVAIQYSRLVEKVVTFNPIGNEQSWEKLEEFRSLTKPSTNTTRQDVSRMTALYAALEEYWHEVRVAKETLIRNNPITNLMPVTPYLRMISVGLTEEHKHRVQEEQEALLHAIEESEKEQQSSAVSVIGEVSTQTPHFKDDSGQRVIRTTEKIKVKTRPEANLAETMEQLLVDEAPMLSNTDSLQLPVNKASIGVFNRVFSKFTTGLTKWNDLVAALADAGFSATSRGGSAVVFKDERSDKGAIAFHRPHPDSRIGPEMLRGMGKRLTKWFGWDEDTFVLRTK